MVQLRLGALAFGLADVKATMARCLSLLLPAALVVTGCWTALPGQSTHAGNAKVERLAGAAAAAQLPFVDLTGGVVVPAGFGRLLVRVRDTSGPERSIQDHGPKNVILVITKPGGGEILDQFGNQAVYSVPMVGGGATIALPGLPQTTTAVSGPQSAQAYVLNLLVGDWGAGFVAPTTYAALAVGQLAYGAETVPGSTFTMNPGTLGKDLVSTSAPAPADYLFATGWARADVSPGLVPVIADIVTFTHTINHFQNSAAYLAPEVVPGSPDHAALLAKGVQNTTSLRNLTADPGGVLRLRHPAIDPNEIDAVTTAVLSVDGTNAQNRRILRVAVQLEGASTFGTPPQLTAWTFDALNGATSSLTPAVWAKPFATFVPNNQNPGYTGTGRFAYADLDVTGPAVDTQIEVEALEPNQYNTLDLAVTGLPPGERVRIWMIPLGTYLTTTGAFSPNEFE